VERTPRIKAIAILLFLLIICSSTLVFTRGEGTSKVGTANIEVIQVEAFMDSTVVLKSDGTVWGWGDNSSGMLGEARDKYVFSPVRLEGLEDIGSISMGNGYLLAVKKDGTVWGAGNNELGILNPEKIGSRIKKPARIKELTEIQAVSAGINYAMAIKNDGTVFLWGDYRYKASETQKHPPRKVNHAKGITSIAASRYNAFVIDNNSRAWFLRGYLHKPEGIENLEEIMLIYESSKLTYAVSKDGSLWYWTINGQFTNKLEGVYGIEKLAAYGANEMIALDKSGFLWKWNQKDMQLGRITGIEAVRDIAAGNSHIAALKQDGTVWTWGDNSHGQLGDGGEYIQRTPLEVPGLKDVKMVSASSAFAAALMQDGTVWMWGDNGYGQLGNGTRESSMHPVKVKGMEGVKYISTGHSHTLALKEDGTVWAWGSNSSGELGDSTYEDRLLPVHIAELKKSVSVSAGNGFSMALAGNGTVWVWGNSSYEPKRAKKKMDTSKPLRVEELSAIAEIEAGDECAMAVKRGGSVWGWGNNFSGQLGFSPNKEDNVRGKPRVVSGCSYIDSVSIGEGHVLSLDSDGLVKSWGSNEYGQLGNDLPAKFMSPRTIEGLGDIAVVTAAGNHSFALDKNGMLWAWGDNMNGQLGPSLGNIIKQPMQVDYLADIKQLACGESYTLALTTGGKLMAWGFNEYGQLGIDRKDSSFVEDPKQIIIP